MILVDLLFKILILGVVLYCLYKGIKLIVSNKLMSGPESIGKSLSFLVFLLPSFFAVLLACTNFIQGSNPEFQTRYQFYLLAIVYFFTGHICARNSERVIKFNAFFLIFLGLLPVVVISFLVSTIVQKPTLLAHLLLLYPPSVLFGAYVYFKSTELPSEIRHHGHE
jgi:hypothetical protein